jgi:hypothetical protein
MLAAPTPSHIILTPTIHPPALHRPQRAKPQTRGLLWTRRAFTAGPFLLCGAGFLALSLATHKHAAAALITVVNCGHVLLSRWAEGCVCVCAGCTVGCVLRAAHQHSCPPPPECTPTLATKPTTMTLNTPATPATF